MDRDAYLKAITCELAQLNPCSRVLAQYNALTARNANGDRLPTRAYAPTSYGVPNTTEPNTADLTATRICQSDKAKRSQRFIRAILDLFGIRPTPRPAAREDRQ